MSVTFSDWFSCMVIRIEYDEITILSSLCRTLELYLNIKSFKDQNALEVQCDNGVCPLQIDKSK